MIRGQDHVIVIRSGRMRWTVEHQTLEAEEGDVIVTPTGAARRVHRLTRATEAGIVKECR
jgi:quercetin dioxygenase-like cupin family protein